MTRRIIVIHGDEALQALVAATVLLDVCEVILNQIESEQQNESTTQTKPDSIGE